MTIKTWVEEFYRHPARDISKEDAVKHSLTKWRGLLQENLDKHKLTLARLRLIDEYGQFFFIDSENCALCKWYIGEDCESCPLLLYLGLDCPAPNSPWSKFRETGDPKPLIEALNALD